MPIKFDVSFVAIQDWLSRGEQPVFMLERPKGHDQPKAWSGPSEPARVGTFWVPREAILTSEKQNWNMTETGAYVRVPIWSYRTAGPALWQVWGLGIQLGMSAINSLREVTQVPVSCVHLIFVEDTVSEVVDPYVQEKMFRCFVGIAIRTN